MLLILIHFKNVILLIVQIIPFNIIIIIIGFWYFMKFNSLVLRISFFKKKILKEEYVVSYK